MELGRICLLLAVAIVLPSSDLMAGETRIGEHTFTLPDGFEIEVAAGQPLVDRPITADFDELGRLYVADSSGSNENVQKQLQEKPHRIVRLEDTNGDGRFDKQIAFADKMMFPEGTLWYDGSLYVAAPPSIWKLTDTDDDGVADRREEWFKGKTVTGCANDLHGPYLGRDGWIYWCKGAFAEQRYELPGQKPLVTRAAHIFRCRPDGSGIEPVMTGGMDNPVDVTFTRGGERIFTTTFLQHPGGGNRDGLIHAIYGGVYGKIHDVLNGHVRTSEDVMPVLCHLGPAAPAGLTTYDSQVFGDEYRDSLFSALFNLQKVTRHVLKPNGASFVTEAEDFLVSDNKDFHPTDVIEDADGSLLVIDTGGWYKLCCPTSQLVKPDVLGAIYRVRKTPVDRLNDPRGLEIDWPSLSVDELAGLLGDPRPAVGQRAIQLLGRRGAESVDAIGRVLRKNPAADARINAVWAATRVESDSARKLARVALSDGDETVRLAAIHSASVWRDGGARERLCEMVVTESSAVPKRAAAEALGRVGGESAIDALLEAAESASDPVLEHSLSYALIEIARPQTVRGGLASGSPAVQRIALIALDQMNDRELEPTTVLPLLNNRDERLQKAALWVLSRHPEWGESVVTHLEEQLSKADRLRDEQRKALAQQLSRFSNSAAVQKLLAADLAADTNRREVAMIAISNASPKEPPQAWIDGLAVALSDADAARLPRLFQAIKSLRIPAERADSIGRQLQRIALDRRHPMEIRIGALSAFPGSFELSDDLFAALRTTLSADDSTTDQRTVAADVLARSKLGHDRLLILTESVADAGPLEIERLVTAFSQSDSDAVGLTLLKALRAAPSLSAIRAEVLTSSLARCSEEVRRQAEQLNKSRLQTSDEQLRQLTELLESLPKGDVRRGQVVFNSTKAACTACHAIGYLGGKLGPDLTKIGEIRTERDLLEAILFPNASFVRSYEPLAVLKTDGTIVSGLVRKDGPDEIVLATTATEEQRVLRSEVEDIRPGTTSIMPAGLDRQLTREQLSDLVAFLKACR